MLAKKHRIRAADRLRTAWLPGQVSTNSDRPAFRQLQNSVRDLRTTRRRLRKVRQHGLQLVESQLLEDMR